MEGVIAATGATVDNGHGALSGKILWQEVRILGMGQVHDMEISSRRRYFKPADVQVGGRY